MVLRAWLWLKVGFMVDLGMALVDNWVVDKENGCYWLSRQKHSTHGKLCSHFFSVIVSQLCSVWYLLMVYFRLLKFGFGFLSQKEFVIGLMK